MHHLLLDFHTRTTLARDVGYFVSIMKSTFNGFSTSSSMMAIFSLPTFHFLYGTDLAEGWMARWWLITLVSIPSMSEEAHANDSTLLMSWSTSSCSSSSKSEVYIFVNWLMKCPIWTSFKSSIGVSLFASISGVLILEVSLWNIRRGAPTMANSSLSITKCFGNTLEWYGGILGLYQLSLQAVDTLEPGT